MVSLLEMVLFSIIGMAVFASGKRNTNLVLLVCGVLLMGYPYFVSGPWLMGIIGASLCTVAWFFRDVGT